MILRFTPQRCDARLEYTVQGELLTVTYTPVEGEPIVDTFDFTGLPDGELDRYGVETVLPYPPIVAAERVDGVLTVTLLHWYRRDESPERAEETH